MWALLQLKITQNILILRVFSKWHFYPKDWLFLDKLVEIFWLQNYTSVVLQKESLRSIVHTIYCDWRGRGSISLLYTFIPYLRRCICFDSHERRHDAINTGRERERERDITHLGWRSPQLSIKLMFHHRKNPSTGPFVAIMKT